MCVCEGGGGGGVLENEIGLYPTHNKMEVMGVLCSTYFGGGGGGVLCSTYFRLGGGGIMLHLFQIGGGGGGVLIILHP